MVYVVIREFFFVAVNACNKKIVRLCNCSNCEETVLTLTAIKLHDFAAKKIITCMGYVANMAICGPFLIFAPTLKRWGPPKREGFCSQFAHLWATSDFVPRSQALGIRETAGVM